jgi:hypothetical protein
LRSNLLYLSYIPPREMRDVRETQQRWVSLISQRTQVENKVRVLLGKNGITD